jgi:hypothetical protein
MTAIATTAVRPAVPTRTLLIAGAVAGPLWAAVSLVQVAVRDGFDLTRHPLSALANGPGGWVQIVNFVVAGVLLLAGAAGLRRVLPGRWAARLARIAGVGMIGAGVLVMDPADGFPAGTPAGMPAAMSWHSIGHMVAGTVSFTALIACCWVLARHVTGGRAALAAAGGAALLVGWGWAMTGGTAGSLTLAVGAIAALLVVSATAAGYARKPHA